MFAQDCEGLSPPFLRFESLAPGQKGGEYIEQNSAHKELKLPTPERHVQEHSGEQQPCDEPRYLCKTWEHPHPRRSVERPHGRGPKWIQLTQQAVSYHAIGTDNEQKVGYPPKRPERHERSIPPVNLPPTC